MNEAQATLTVRLATPQDSNELALLMSLFDGETVTPTRAADRLKAADGVETAILVEQERKIIGLASLRLVAALSSDTPHAEIAEFYVEKAHQDGNVERLLLRSVEALARQRGATQIILLTGMKNTDAQSCYRASGYQEFALAMRKPFSETFKVEGTSAATHTAG